MRIARPGVVAAIIGCFVTVAVAVAATSSGWIGVSVQEMNADFSGYFGFKGKNGVLVSRVVPAGPADKAGVKAGDIITAFNGNPVGTLAELARDVSVAEPGTLAKVLLVRDAKNLEFEVHMAEKPLAAQKSVVASKAFAVPMQAWRGIHVALVETGVAISGIDPGSPALAAGLKEGEVIDEIDRHRTYPLSAFGNAIGQAKGTSLVRTGRGYFLVKDQR